MNVVHGDAALKVLSHGTMLMLLYTACLQSCVCLRLGSARAAGCSRNSAASLVFLFLLQCDAWLKCRCVRLASCCAGLPGALNDVRHSQLRIDQIPSQALSALANGNVPPKEPDSQTERPAGPSRVSATPVLRAPYFDDASMDDIELAEDIPVLPSCLAGHWTSGSEQPCTARGKGETHEESGNACCQESAPAYLQKVVARAGLSGAFASAPASSTAHALSLAPATMVSQPALTAPQSALSTMEPTLGYAVDSTSLYKRRRCVNQYMSNAERVSGDSHLGSGHKIFNQIS